MEDDLRFIGQRVKAVSAEAESIERELAGHGPYALGLGVVPEPVVLHVVPDAPHRRVLVALSRPHAHQAPYGGRRELGQNAMQQECAQESGDAGDEHAPHLLQGRTCPRDL